ncbi:hypothetical protein CISIN_1g038816mg [Citrus sinensis]|uniref:Uncharacterized protein n=1 Tax=Citrus sinensis TaxID=2711 RepID=A0A067DU72_CITSI|nr:hypothetical protein CISIN_1g038816mg [Citrus sinensis]
MSKQAKAAITFNPKSHFDSRHEIPTLSCQKSTSGLNRLVSTCITDFNIWRTVDSHVQVNIECQSNYLIQ